MYVDYGVSREELERVLSSPGFAAYDAVFCTDRRPAPYILVLQDHGFGGNWNRFGAGGVLEKIASGHGVYPDYMLVADKTKAWDGYEHVPNTSCVIGGMRRFRRYLYSRTSPAS